MFIRPLFVIAALLACSCYAKADPAAPFNLILGKTTLQEVAGDLAKRTHLEQTGTSAINGGPILKGDGAGLDLPDLKAVMLIFDKADVLQLVQLTLPNGGMRAPTFTRFDTQLQKKYRRTRYVAPFVGNRLALYKADNATIELSAPHMSFDLTVTYMTPSFDAAFDKYQVEKERQRQGKEASSL